MDKLDRRGNPEHVSPVYWSCWFTPSCRLNLLNQPKLCFTVFNKALVLIMVVRSACKPLLIWLQVLRPGGG